MLAPMVEEGGGGSYLGCGSAVKWRVMSLLFTVPLGCADSGEGAARGAEAVLDAGGKEFISVLASRPHHFDKHRWPAQLNSMGTSRKPGNRW